jgi:methylglyoxal synthase
VFKKRTRATARVLSMAGQKRIALVAHQRRTNELLEWVEWNCETLARHSIVSTRSTGRLVEEALYRRLSRNGDGIARYPRVLLLRPRALGGHRELAGLIAEGTIDLLVFFEDAVSPSALLRIAGVRNIPIACNRATADFIISSPFLGMPRVAG